MKRKILILLVVFIFITLGFVSSQMFSSSSTTYQKQADFQTYYSSSDINTYWPVLSNKEDCKARQDIILNVAPGGCQPGVVRSDLLADQNVPVFCQIDALQINPLIDIKQIKNIRFTGTYPAEVAGTGFHPARAAVRTTDTLLGSPLVNNIGYVVVILKRTPAEKTTTVTNVTVNGTIRKNVTVTKLPDFVVVNLTAQLEYDAGNAIGIGRTEFILEPPSQNTATAEVNKIKNSFWGGRYSLNLEEADVDFATVSLYDGDAKISTIRIKKGETSKEIYLPGSYCMVALQAQYNGLDAAKTKATLQITNDKGTDTMDVYEGSSFLNDKCKVGKIGYSKESELGNVTITCSGKSFMLTQTPIATPGLQVIIITKDKLKDQKGVIDKLVKGGVTIKLREGDKIGEVIKDDKGNERVFASGEYRPEVLSDNDFSIDANQNKAARTAFEQVISAYELVYNDYPQEKTNVEGVDTLVGYATYSEEALSRAKDFSGRYEQFATKESLLTKLIAAYPSSKQIDSYQAELADLYTLDLSSASASIDANGRANTIRLVRVREPLEENKPRATFILNGAQIGPVPENGNPYTSPDGFKLQVVKVGIDSATVNIACKDKGKDVGASNLVVKLSDSGQSICNAKYTLKLSELTLQKAARVTLLPSAKNAGSITNLTVRIGIEKRAIQLSPERTRDRIKNINESIAKWESISERLGKVVKGLKSACLATSLVLTVKSFATGIGGTTLARQQAMSGANGWKVRCQNAINDGWIDRNGNGQEDGGERLPTKYTTVTECFNREENNINSEIDARKNVIDTVNKDVQQVEQQAGVKSGNLVTGAKVDEKIARDKYLDILKSKYPNEAYIQQLQVNPDGTAPFTYTDLRQMDYNLELQKTPSLAIPATTAMTDLEKNIDAQKKNLDSALQDSKTTNMEVGSIGLLTERKTSTVDVRDLKKEGDSWTAGGKKIIPPAAGLPEDSAVALVSASASNPNDPTAKPENKKLLIVGTRSGGELNPSAAYTYETDASGNIVVKDLQYVAGGNKNQIAGATSDTKDISELNSDYSFSTLKDKSSPVEGYPIRAEDRKVRYFETGPDKGLASQVPFDLEMGWYVRVDSSLKIGNNIAAYDASGLPKAWNICNVGPNKIIEQDDVCFFYTGVSIDRFLDLSPERSKKLLDDSRTAIRQANNAAGGSSANILGKTLQKGAPTSAFAGTECQEFMSIDDCKVLFNVCDPVICPATRCNFGGLYPVSDVIQSGIVGSALLCLPNYKEPIFIPVCLTGIQSGIDAWVSILKNHRDCLQENLDKGTMSGICDQMYSIYLCDFFWRQVGPMANILIPKLIESAYKGGQGARGGGEYLTVQSAWDNTQKSMNYITQTYATNSFKAFQAKSISEVGAEVCKMYVSAKGPSALQSLVEPESPPQFHAWFSTTKYSDATVPATSQYKVFYHIFAGKAAGTYYSVYLKNPPDSPYYAQMSTVQVASGFAKKGDYASETKDFTAPEGYKELCVRINNEEKCGFQQVSSSYAVNTLRDMYTSDQLKQTDIKSQSECISGSVSVGALLANTNPQAALEEAALPQISNRGIVRVCSTKNPAETTEPGRWKEVGYCDTQSMKCWLDSNSVDNAITANNLGLKNATLTELNNNLNKDLASSKDVFIGEAGVTQLRALRQLVDNIKAGDTPSADVVLGRIDSLVSMFVLNNQKASLFLTRAIVVNKSKGPGIDIIWKARTAPAGGGAWCIGTGKLVYYATNAQIPLSGNCFTSQADAQAALAAGGGGTITASAAGYSLESSWKGPTSDEIFVMKDNARTSFYVTRSTIELSVSGWFDRTVGDLIVSRIDKTQRYKAIIKFRDASKSDIPLEIYNALNGKVLVEKEQKIMTPDEVNALINPVTAAAAPVPPAGDVKTTADCTKAGGKCFLSSCGGDHPKQLGACTDSPNYAPNFPVYCCSVPGGTSAASNAPVVTMNTQGYPQEIAFVFNNQNYKLVSNPKLPTQNGKYYYLVYKDGTLDESYVVEADPKAIDSTKIISGFYKYGGDSPYSTTNIDFDVSSFSSPASALKQAMQEALFKAFSSYVKTLQVLTLDNNPTTNDKVRIMVGSQFTGLNIEKLAPADATGTQAGATHLVWTDSSTEFSGGTPIAKVSNNQIIFNFDKASTLPKIKNVQEDVGPLRVDLPGLASALGVSEGDVADKIYDLLDGAIISGQNINSNTLIVSSSSTGTGGTTAASPSVTITAGQVETISFSYNTANTALVNYDNTLTSSGPTTPSGTAKDLENLKTVTGVISSHAKDFLAATSNKEKVLIAYKVLDDYQQARALLVKLGGSTTEVDSSISAIQEYLNAFVISNKAASAKLSPVPTKPEIMVMYGLVYENDVFKSFQGNADVTKYMTLTYLVSEIYAYVGILTQDVKLVVSSQGGIKSCIMTGAVSQLPADKLLKVLQDLDKDGNTFISPEEVYNYRADLCAKAQQAK